MNNEDPYSLKQTRPTEYDDYDESDDYDD